MGSFRPVQVSVLLIAIGLNVVVSGCNITENSGTEPFLVRIIECLDLFGYPFRPNETFTGFICAENITVAHGSLIAPDKVLSTCSWDVRGYPPTTRFRIYDQGQKCFQERFRKAMILHSDCNRDNSGELFLPNDFGVWITDKPFDVTVKALLWRGLKPPKWKDLKEVIKKINRNDSTCTTAVFKNASAVDEQQQESKIEIMPWTTDCVKFFEKVFPGDGDSAKYFSKIGIYAYLCGKTDLPSENFPVGKVLNNDWHTGAAVVCKVGSKKVTVGMLSRVINPPPWAPKKFRMAVIFHRSFYVFLRDKFGIESDKDAVLDDCLLSGRYYFPYLLRITKAGQDFQPPYTVGHGALIRKNMVLSSCTPYKDLPKDLSQNEDWTFWAYNRVKGCLQRRSPRLIYKHPDCTKSEPGRIMLNDFAFWEPMRPFGLEFDRDAVYPNLWAGPSPPSYAEVARSFMELSQQKYVDIVSHTLSVGVFNQPNVEGYQTSAEIQFVSWADCKDQLELLNVQFIPGLNDFQDPTGPPLFCGYEQFSPTSPQSNDSSVDWYSGAILMYSFLYVFDWGDEPVVRTCPLGLLSRLYRGQAPTEDDGSPPDANLRVVSAFGPGFYEFMGSIDKVLNPTTYGGQMSLSTTGLAGMGLGVLATFLS